MHASSSSRFHGGSISRMCRLASASRPITSIQQHTHLAPPARSALSRPIGTPARTIADAIAWSESWSSTLFCHRQDRQWCARSVCRGLTVVVQRTVEPHQLRRRRRLALRLRMHGLGRLKLDWLRLRLRPELGLYLRRRRGGVNLGSIRRGSALRCWHWAWWRRWRRLDEMLLRLWG